MAEHNLFGKLAEQKACQFLEQKGYCCIEKNYCVGRAEIDLIMQRGEILICVEVKARKTQFFGTPASFISSAKIKRLCAAMDHYIIQKELNVEVRFDVIECIVQQNQWIINHIPNAFYPWE
jgi:putative endonuclease